ncbi:carbohydrate-binding protein [Aquimarina addita]
MKNFQTKGNPFKLWIAIAILLLYSPVVTSQIGEVIWEDNFNTFNTDIWNPIEGDGCDIGLCGWGNAELEYYRGNNITIESIPGESGNNALVLEAKNESFGGSSFTSGKVDTDGNLSVQYGLIEIRMRTPNLDSGLWPAAWLLGTSNLSWPAKGEIDIMEMGHAVEERERQGHPGADINSYVGANAIFANEDGSVGSIAYDVGYNQPYVSSTSMADRFVTYRLYWEPTQMRYTIVDNGTEYDLYTGPLPLDPDGVTGVFNRPFFFLLNLAVGGNFTDAAAPGQVSAPLPAKLYIDYVRVSKWNGYGTVETDYGGLAEESGTFGVFTENTPTANELTFGNDGEIYVWGGTMQEGTTAPYEGSEVIAWETLNANSWFGGGISAIFGKDMSNYVENGSLKFRINIPADVSFRVGITDNFTNESFVNFPAGETKYGLTRNGQWGEVEIPLEDFAGLIAFQNINYMFAISSIDGSFPSTTFQFGVDDIVWEDGNGNTTVSVTGISVSPSNTSLSVGSTQQITATINPSGASNQNITWSSSNTSIATVSTDGLITAQAAGSATITATTADGNFTASTIVTVTTSGATFVPDPNKTYYIDNPHHGLRIGANGAQDPFTTSTSVTGESVTWKITPSTTDGYYYIDCIGGGSRPRMRGDNSAYTDMQATTSKGSWTKWKFTAGSVDGTFLLTTLGNTLPRLQINNVGETKMVTTASTGTWERFIISEAINTTSPSSIRIEAEDYAAMSGIQTETTTDTGGGLNVGYIDNGDWMDYTVDIPVSGTYTVDFRVASVPGSAAVQFIVDTAVLGTANIAPTGGWQEWTTVSTSVDLLAGTQTIRLFSPGQNFNINWFEITNGASSKDIEDNSTKDLSIASVYPVPAQNELNLSVSNPQEYTSLQVIDITGKLVMVQPSINSKLTSLNISELPQGIYFLKLFKANNSSELLRFAK